MKPTTAAARPLAYGAIDGMYTGATALLRLVGGYVADRVRKPKAVAGIGYAMSALAKLGLLAVGRTAGAIGLVVAVDRAGKGLRTAPRDALITLSAPPHALGRAFGVHRAMDSFGAFLGPLVAPAVLAVAGQAFDAVLVTSFCIAALGVLVLVPFVRDRHDERPPARPASPREALTLLRVAPVRRLLLAACLLGFAVIGDGFVHLLLQRQEEVSLGSFPLLAVGTSLTYLLPAVPVGALADRIGRVPVVLSGYTALLLVYPVVKDGKPYRSADVNYWGVTFTEDDNTFYATMYTKGHRYLVRGDFAARTVRTVRDRVECPSLSPDGTRIAFKAPIDGDSTRGRRLSVLDVATGRVTATAETRSVDDQAAWLDDATLAYAQQHDDGTKDLWSVPADGSGTPRQLLRNAHSPAPLG